MNSLPSQFEQWLADEPPARLVALVSLLLLLIGVFDHISTVEMAYGLFYIIPILIVTWKWGKSMGVFMAGVCTIVWAAIDFFDHPSVSLVVQTWNVVIQFGIFSVVASMLASLREQSSTLKHVNAELMAAMDEVRRLSGILPICAWCKKIRDTDGQWLQLEQYLSSHAEVDFTHSICPECSKQYRSTIDKTRAGGRDSKR